MVTEQTYTHNHLSPNWRGLGGDLTAATVAALLVSPTATTIDRSLVEKASYNEPLLRIRKKAGSTAATATPLLCDAVTTISARSRWRSSAPT
ncbi:hypothetical protein BDW68DRAFT_181664 [Aspergillus falconensis]